LFETRKSLALIAIVGALGFAGCGGDDDEDTSTTTTSGATGASGASGTSGASALLPADFIAEADAICKKADDEVDNAGQALGQDASQADQVKFVKDVVAPSIEAQIDDVRALGAPDTGAEELSAFLDDADKAVDQIKADPESIFSGDDPFKGIEAQAKALGLEECGS
jgi:hypothetical protein